jgi:hypothetical protein
MSQKIEPRWLDPERAADYIGVRMPQLTKMAKDGLVKPNYMLGPRRPRYDRLELDAMFNKNNGKSIDTAIQEAIANGAIETRRQAEARRRNDQDIRIRSKP